MGRIHKEGFYSPPCAGRWIHKEEGPEYPPPYD